MTSAFICELSGVLTDGTETSLEYLKYGQGLWWNSERMLNQLRKVLALAKRLYPWARFLFKFDHSSNHTAMAADALNAKKMNVNQGGAQPKLRDGMWMGMKQAMVDEHGVAKGLKWVLEERLRPDGRSLYSEIAGTGKHGGVVQDDLVAKLSACDDFQNQPNLITELIENEKHICVFYPKFHCELSPIERFWCEHKRYVRSHCRMKFSNLRQTVQDGFEAICPDLVIRLCTDVYSFSCAGSTILCRMSPLGGSVSTGRCWTFGPQGRPKISESKGSRTQITPTSTTDTNPYLHQWSRNSSHSSHPHLRQNMHLSRVHENTNEVLPTTLREARIS